MGSTADDAARAAAERHDRHAAAVERHERQVERAGPRPMIQSDTRKTMYVEGQSRAWQLIPEMKRCCKCMSDAYIAGFCDAIADALTDCREAAEGGTDDGR